MAKISNPYSCDECGVPKKPSNGWFLWFSTGENIVIGKWSDETAEKEGVKHLCGISCVLKVSGREMVKFYGTEHLNDRNS